jgi:hypothetical protein
VSAESNNRREEYKPPTGKDDPSMKSSGPIVRALVPVIGVTIRAEFTAEQTAARAARENAPLRHHNEDA